MANNVKIGALDDTIADVTSDLNNLNDGLDQLNNTLKNSLSNLSNKMDKVNLTLQKTASESACTSGKMQESGIRDNDGGTNYCNIIMDQDCGFVFPRAIFHLLQWVEKVWLSEKQARHHNF